jgi:hypothetical protein
LWFKLTDTWDIEKYIDKSRPGMDIKPRTIEDALRRRQLRFYQVGQKRYTTPLLIDEWLNTLLTAAAHTS